MHHVDVVRLDVVEEALVVRDENDGSVVPPASVDAGRDGAQGVDVETGVLCLLQFFF